MSDTNHNELKKGIPLGAKLAIVGVGIMALFVGYFGWLTFSPFNPAEVHVPITVQNHEVTEGTPVFLILESCTFVEVPVKVEVQLVGGDKEHEFVLPLLTVSGQTTKKECTKGQQSPIPLNKSQFPLAIVSGTYRVRLHTTYTVNKIRTEIVDYDSEEFNYTTTTPTIPKEQ
jgi:hypothetical protein